MCLRIDSRNGSEHPSITPLFPSKSNSRQAKQKITFLYRFLQISLESLTICKYFPCKDDAKTFASFEFPRVLNWESEGDVKNIRRTIVRVIGQLARNWYADRFEFRAWIGYRNAGMACKQSAKTIGLVKDVHDDKRRSTPIWKWKQWTRIVRAYVVVGIFLSFFFFFVNLASRFKRSPTSF